MADEVTTETTEISSEDLGEQIYADALARVEPKSEETQTPETDQSEAEVKEETQTEEVAEETEVSQPETTTEVKTEEVVETKQPETKPLYTPEEIENEIKTHGDLAQLDSSRLSAEGKLIQASMQRGFTPKLQRAAEIEKNFQALLEKNRAEEQMRAKAESERKYREEAEQYGEEEAKRLQEVRGLRAEIEAIKQQQASRDAELQREQNQIAIERYKNSFREKAPKYGIPVTDEWSDMVQAKILAENQVRYTNGEPFISLDDAMQKISKTVGISDVDSLEGLLNANPKLREALENKFKEKYNAKKSAGPTTVKTSGGGSSGIMAKSAKEKLLENPTGDMEEDIIKLAMLELEKNKPI